MATKAVTVTIPEPAPEPADPKLELIKKLGEFLKQFNGLESSIPLNHEYWAVLAELRAYR